MGKKNSNTGHVKRSSKTPRAGKRGLLIQEGEQKKSLKILIEEVERQHAFGDETATCRPNPNATNSDQTEHVAKLEQKQVTEK